MMNRSWKIGIAAVMLSVSLIHGEASASNTGLPSDTHDAVVTISQSQYGLVQDIQATVKSVSIEPTKEGYRIAATVRVYNGGSEKTRIPDHELRVQLSDGVEMKLDPSSNNRKALQPSEIAELVYMSVIDSSTPVQVTSLSLVKVDEYTYPKQEKVLLSLPLNDQVWYGAVNAAAKLKSLAWRETFTIPRLNSSLRYTPVGYSVQHADSGPTAVVTLLAENPGSGREIVPDFRLDARTESNTYTGKRTDTENTALEPGEKTYIYTVIPLENNVSVSSLLVMTTDMFMSSGSSTGIAIDTGKLTLFLPEGGYADPASANGSYTMGQRITLDPMSKMLDQTEVSLMELHFQQNPKEGYKTAIAKFKLINLSDKPVPMLNFETELAGSGGAAYAGARQSNMSATLNPGLSYVVSYAFHVPQTESGSSLTLKLLDTKAASPYKLVAASLQPQLQQHEGSKLLKMYPFDVNLVDWSTSTNYNASNSSYSYKIKLNLDIKQVENVVVDSGFSKLHFEVIDKLGRVLGTAEGVFTGNQQLISGTQTILTNNIQSEQFEFPIVVNVYELTETSSGHAKRLLTTLN
ncbi:hypothetical protein OB236_11140 [Paenibacillus sp. WQ 127069]|uniref:Uncharacterized protein n=1 Tax=Paenibacillus baimaensis TaxID=2982185 RepID=A0ABT2UDF5_9BACL|nr:hypothetical protein [Paenibacillus sp. WQ 127069]MCU6792674.1 hypothetical protein [Paenibacillus sp. WQ 127069]